jgi:hypothetical protein
LCTAPLSSVPVSYLKYVNYYPGRMAFSGMLRREALVRTDVLEEHNSSIIRVTLAGTSNLKTLQ